ncbi:MAG: polysaccharide biosynthesis protein [Clostridia bacterium]|nr:polysaccharide biosynthesis protein [Clostridia bacterium]
MNFLSSRSKRHILRTVTLLIADIVIINLAQFLALFIRHELSMTLLRKSGYLESVIRFAPIVTAAALILFAVCGLYTNVWSSVGLRDVLRIGAANAFLALGQYFAMALMELSIPRSFPVLFWLFLTAMMILERMALISARHIRSRIRQSGKRKRTMLIGGGEAGLIILQEFINSKDSKNKVVCIIDDNKDKWKLRLDGVPVVGGRESIAEAAKKYEVEEIVFTIPSCIGSERREIISRCQNTGLPLKILPGLAQIANGDVTVSRLRKVEIEDLLGRDSVKVNMEEIGANIKGKTVLVTGGGGSIGSELCRQVAAREPGKLVIFDIYENNAYAIQQELLRKYGDALPLEVRIGSVRDAKRVDMLFEEFKPDIVYHAAAHKHVPLMEESPCEAIKNNVFGTYHVASAADRYGTDTFVMISTDKAVNPTNIMGASKRVCEMIVQTFAKKSVHTRFVAVRFGNVLGSNGSVIPLFRKQIEEGGPVTVTHKDIIRYFMTIPEAVSLVMQAGVYAKGGEIFVLDMGDPVRIDDLARNMIRLSGMEPDVDIKIVYTGLRPGEKLYEELLMSEEGMGTTANDLIFIGHPAEFSEDQLRLSLEALGMLCETNDQEGIIDAVTSLVTTYHPSRN